MRSRWRTGAEHGRERDLIEAGLNEAAAMASDGKDFKASGLRRAPGSNARTTWTLRHGCCYMGKWFLSGCDFKRLRAVRRSSATTSAFRARQQPSSRRRQVSTTACGKSPCRPLDVGSRSFWSPAHQHRLSAYHPNEPISHKHAVGVSVRKKLQCRDSGFVQSTLRIGA